MNPDQIDEGEEETPLLVATRRQNARIMDILLRYGAATSATDPELNTPLHVAIRRNSVECVQTLLRYECPVNQEGLGHMTPLMLASLIGSKNIVAHLLRVRTINVSYMNTRRRSALILAVLSVSICSL